MEPVADNVTAHAIAPKTIPASAPLLIHELGEGEITATIIKQYMSTSDQT